MMRTLKMCSRAFYIVLLGFAPLRERGNRFDIKGLYHRSLCLVFGGNSSGFNTVTELIQNYNKTMRA